MLSENYKISIEGNLYCYLVVHFYTDIVHFSLNENLFTKYDEFLVFY